MQLTLRVKDNIYEEMKQRMAEKKFSSMNAYLVDLIVKDLEIAEPKPLKLKPIKVSLDTLLSDHYLMHWFIGKHNDTIEEFQETKTQKITTERRALSREDILSLANSVIRKKWNKLKKSEKEFWLELIEKWLSKVKVYKDFTLRDLLHKWWISDTVSEFAEYLGVSYQEAYYKIKPKLRKMATYKDFELYRPDQFFAFQSRARMD